MKRPSYLTLALVLATLAIPAYAQERSFVPLPDPNPSLSLSAPATSPLQSQMEDDYATQLMEEQRQLLQQNPSGLTRQELSIGNTLNGFTPR